MGGRLFEAGRLLTFPTYRVGAYSRWTLIRGSALNRKNTVFGNNFKKQKTLANASSIQNVTEFPAFLKLSV